MYYFDYASTTKPSEKNIELYTKLLRDVYDHPDSDNKAGKLMIEAQNILRTSLQLNNAYEVIFTSGGTEANNLAIIGYAQNFTSPKHFITSKYEHSSVDSSFKYIETLGHQVTYLNITDDGQIDYEQLENSISDNTVMVSIMAVNNEIGTINDEHRIKSIINQKKQDIIYMADCVQAIGKVNYDYQQLDILTIAGHKIFGPKGCGAIIYRRGINIKNVIFGGQQQGGIRPGTISVCSAVVLAVAVQTEMDKLEATITHTTKLTNQFTDYINNHPKINLNVQPMSSTVSVNFKTKALSESLISVLNQLDIYASTRSACSKKLNVPSRTLSSLGLTQDKIDRSIRFSFSHDTTEQEVEYLIKQLNHVLEIY